MSATPALVADDSGDEDASPDSAVRVAETAPLNAVKHEGTPTPRVSFASQAGTAPECVSSAQTLRSRTSGRVKLRRTQSQAKYLERDDDVRVAFEAGIEEAFNIFADGSKQLTEHAAASLLRFLDKTPPQFMIDNEARVAAGIDIGRTSTKGTIDKEAFTTMLLESITSTDWADSAADVFEQLDKARNNRMTAKALRRAFRTTFNSIELSKSDAEEMVRLADRGGKGYVDWDDFQMLLQAIEYDIQGRLPGGGPTDDELNGPRIPLPKYLRDARKELQRKEQTRPALLKCCAWLGCGTLARSKDIFELRRSGMHTQDVGAAKDNTYWKIVHIYTRSGLLGRVRGQGEFWHGHEAARQIGDEDDTPPCSETFVITPGNTYAVLWDAVMILLLIFVTITEPFRVGFSIGAKPWEPLFVIDVCIDIFFVCDMVLQFFTAFSDSEGTGSLETDWRKTARQYATTWFVWDLISVFPFTYILQPWRYEGEVQVVEDSRLLRFARLPRLIKLLRLARVKRVIERYAEIWVSVRTLLQHYDLIVLILKTILLAHIMACLWFFFGSLNSEQEHYDSDVTSWLQNQYPDEPILRNDQNRTVDWFVDRYTVSLYWAFTTITTVGYGDITATNVLEQILCLICMVIGVFVFTTVAAQLHSQLETAQAGQFEAEKKISKLVSFLKQRQVLPELRNQIRDFYVTKYRYQYTCGFDQEEMLQELPPTLARDLTEHLYAKYWQIETMKFWRILMFSRLDRRDQVALCKAFKSIFVGVNSSVYDQHDFGLGIFVLLRGKVMLTRTHGVLSARQMLTDMQVSSDTEFAKLYKPGSRVAFSFTFDKGDCLGEVETIAELETDHSIPRYGDSRVTSRRGAELLALDEEALSNFAEHHPELLKRFEEVARVREEKICQRLVQDLKEWTQFLFNVVLSKQAADADNGSSTDQVTRLTFEKYFSQIAMEIYNQPFIAEDLLRELQRAASERRPESGAVGNDRISREDVDNWLVILEDSVRHHVCLRLRQFAPVGGTCDALMCGVLRRTFSLPHTTHEYTGTTCVA